MRCFCCSMTAIGIALTLTASLFDAKHHTLCLGGIPLNVPLRPSLACLLQFLTAIVSIVRCVHQATRQIHIVIEIIGKTNSQSTKCHALLSVMLLTTSNLGGGNALEIGGDKIDCQSPSSEPKIATLHECASLGSKILTAMLTIPCAPFCRLAFGHPMTTAMRASHPVSPSVLNDPLLRRAIIGQSLSHLQQRHFFSFVTHHSSLLVCFYLQDYVTQRE